MVWLQVGFSPVWFLIGAGLAGVALAPLYLVITAVLQFITRGLGRDVPFGELVARLVFGSVFGAFGASLVWIFARAEDGAFLMGCAVFVAVTSAVMAYMAYRAPSDVQAALPAEVAAWTFGTTAFLMAFGMAIVVNAFVAIATFVSRNLIMGMAAALHSGDWATYGAVGVEAVAELLESIPTF